MDQSKLEFVAHICLRSDAQPKNKQKRVGEWGAREDTELNLPKFQIKTDRSSKISALL